MLTRRATIAFSILLGVALELSIHWLTGRREAWDSELFWMFGIPIAVLASAVLGFFSSGANWLWTVLVAPSQVATMMLVNREIGGLWPLTIFFSAILSAPFLIAALIASSFRRKSRTA